ncbi:Uncharacterised protein [uncultured archaeon]|nr:Uncharacterised protein [uncultured archaeon]
MKKKHPYTHTHVEHHEDGSHTVHHVHKDGPHKDVKGAVANHDAMIDHMMEHTSAPNPGEEHDENSEPMAASTPTPIPNPVMQGA